LTPPSGCCATSGFASAGSGITRRSPRLELGRDEIARALDPEIAGAIDRGLRALGYAHVTVDLRGYRLGSLNDALTLRPI